MAAAAAHAVKNNRKLHPKDGNASQVVINSPARHGWGETAQALHGEIAQIPGAAGGRQQQSGRRRNREVEPRVRSPAMLPPSEESPRAIEGGGSADVILYVGLAMISLGLLITFLGLGEGTSGFKTMEMKLIGPSLVGCGVFFAVLRILFCTVPSFCRTIFGCCRRRAPDKQKLVEVMEKEDDLMTTKLSLGVTMRSLRPPRPAPRTVKKTAPSLVAERKSNKQTKKGKKVVEEEENDSDASSTFSLEAGVGPEMARRPPHLGGSTKNLRAGGITLNAARLA